VTSESPSTGVLTEAEIEVLARRAQEIARGMGHYDNIQTSIIHVIRRLALDRAMAELAEVDRGGSQEP